MPFEGQESRDGRVLSPGGFEFGIQGWTWGPPIPRSITFFLDNTAIVTDQYGRQIRAAQLNDGSIVKFADSPGPDGNGDNAIVPRPQFATHAQVIAALEAEHIDWQAYEVSYVKATGGRGIQTGLTQEKALETQRRLIDAGNREVLIGRSIVYAGWPQLPYEQLKKLKEVPMTPANDLRKIRDPELRKAALRLRSEVDDARMKERDAEEVDAARD